MKHRAWSNPVSSAIALVVALGAAAKNVPAPNRPTPADLSGIDAFRQGLAGLMRGTAQHLTEGARFEATKNLNEARHLGETARTAKGLSPDVAGAFKDAAKAVTKARHVLQNGDPEHAGKILTEAAGALEHAQLSSPAGTKLGDKGPKDAVGSIVINARGETLGDLQSLDTPPQGPALAHVVLGGLFGIGGKVVAVPTNQVLIGDTYVALSSDVSRHELENR